MHPCPHAAQSQSGALFGLDARIALAIFSIVAVVAGVAVVANFSDTKAKSLGTELTETGHAIELMQSNLKTDIFRALSQPSGKNAFQALYDNQVIMETYNLRARWNGPYIKFTSNINPRYGDMLLLKGADDHTQPCTGNEMCYLYLVYSRMPLDVLEAVNALIDGEAENQPSFTGRVQWHRGDAGEFLLYYRAQIALTPDYE